MLDKRTKIRKVWLGLSVSFCCFLTTTITFAEPPTAVSPRTAASANTPSRHYVHTLMALYYPAQAFILIKKAVAIASTAAGATTPATGLDIDTLMSRYYDLKNINPDQAFILIKKIVEMYPKSAEAQAEYGYLLFEKKQYSEALNQLQIAEQLNPKNDDVKLQIAYSLGYLGQKQKAQEKFKEIAAYATDPKIVKEAKDNLASASSAGPATGAQTDVDSELAQYYALKSKGPSQAGILLKNIVVKYPQSKEAREEYAYILFNKKQYKEALPQFIAAEKLDPTNDDIKLQIAYSLQYLGQKQKAYLKFKNIAAHAKGPKVVEEAKAGMAATSPSAEGASIQSGVNDLLDTYYKLKKENPAAALVLIERIVATYPTSREARTEYAYLLSDQKRYQEALQQFCIASQQNPCDFDVQLGIADTLTHLDQKRAAYFKFNKIAKSTCDPKILKEARQGMIDLAGYQTRILPRHFFADLYLDPYHISRFNDFIYYAQARAGLQFGSWNQLQFYATTYFLKDTASTSGVTPATYNDNAIIYDFGIRYTPLESGLFYLYIEGGRAHNLILDNGLTNRWTKDFRGGLDLYHDWGMQPEYAERVKLPFKQVGNVYFDASYYSRYDRDWIGQLRVREGVRAFEFQYTAFDLFLQLEAFADTQLEFFNNIVDYGPGFTLYPDVRWPIAFRTIALRNSYINVGSPQPNPYSPHFSNVLVELEAYFQI